MEKYDVIVIGSGPGGYEAAAMAAAAACTLAAWGLTALVSPEAAWGFLTLVLLALCAALDRWLATHGAKRFLEL